MRATPKVFILVALLYALGVGPPAIGEESLSQAAIRRAVEKALPLLETAAVGASDHNRCFTCHNHGVPVLAMVEAKKRGFKIDQEIFDRLISHTAAHLERGKANYSKGIGQGGKTDTAGYAIWALHASGYERNEITDSVVTYFLKANSETPYWKASSSRPPSQGSKFTSSYLGLRALEAYGVESESHGVGDRRETVQNWLIKSEPLTTEEHIFRLLALDVSKAEKKVMEVAALGLLSEHQSDGGWRQMEELEADAYATGSALFALNHSGFLNPESSAYRKGIRFLIDSQLDDGSWRVATRSRPIQKHYESGFPHGKDQFISCAATAWATIALLQALPEPEVKLPKVLLIGDSISMGYTEPVQKLLNGKADVRRIPANGGPTSRGLANIDKWLGDGKWDLIHFNWGIHDLKHMDGGKRQVEPADYEKNLRELIAKLKATGAKLIWASTTPIPEPPLNPIRTFGDEVEYNALAAKVMAENEIPIDDLYGWMKPRFEEFHKPKDLHYNAEGYEFLAEKVAAEIEKALKITPDS